MTRFLTRFLPAFLLVLLSANLAHAQAAKVAGDWEGTMPDGRHIVLHFTAETATALSGTIDSPDQGAYDIPLSDVTCKDGALSASVAMVQGVYKATLSADGKTLTGSWTQGGGEPTPLNFTRAAATPTTPPPPPPASSPTANTGPSIDGTWKGALDLGSMQLHIVLHIVTSAAGLSITLDSPDQGAMGIPCHEIARDGKSLAFHGPAGGTFAGTISADAGTITGTWSQSGHELPVIFTLQK